MSSATGAFSEFLKPADNDEIILESRSSEHLLRNGISDISVEQRRPFQTSETGAYTRPLYFRFLLWDADGATMDRCPGEWTCAVLGGRKAVSLVMTPAHVLRLASTPEPEKVNPLVLPWQEGEDLLGLPTV